MWGWGGERVARLLQGEDLPLLSRMRASIANNCDTTGSPSFTYDALNRIPTAKTSSTSGTKCWDEQFAYDPWANLLTIGRISGYTCSNEELLNLAATPLDFSERMSSDKHGHRIDISIAAR